MMARVAALTRATIRPVPDTAPKIATIHAMMLATRIVPTMIRLLAIAAKIHVILHAPIMTHICAIRVTQVIQVMVTQAATPVITAAAGAVIAMMEMIMKIVTKTPCIHQMSRG
jgi:hypothetical protein